MLAEISLDTEFKIHEITILLFLKELRRFKSLPSGFKRDLLMNPSLFLTDNAIVMARLHEG